MVDFDFLLMACFVDAIWAAVPLTSQSEDGMREGLVLLCRA